MQVARPLERPTDHSPLAAARLHRKLTVDETARRTGLTAEQVEWLEEGRVYRFPSTDAALLALVLYSTGLGIDHREARGLAGLPVAPAPPPTPVGRYIGAGAVLAALVATLAIVVWPGIHLTGGQHKAARAFANLPPVWKISVDVLNGSGDRNYTGRVANRIGGLGYRIGRIARASSFGYRETTVYYEPGGEANGTRLAEQLGVSAAPLPGGSNPRRLVVIVGPHRGPG
jgi:transcriptional regulator with XRE-family HTH domain